MEEEEKERRMEGKEQKQKQEENGAGELLPLKREGGDGARISRR